MKFDHQPPPPLPVGHTLLISCPNNGGLVSVHAGRVNVIDHIDTIGLHASPELFVRAHQTDTKAFLDLFTNDGVRSLVLDEVEDLHDLLVHENRIYAVSTGTNEVLVYNLAGRLLERVRHAGEKDSWHLNCIAPLAGGLAVSAFGSFSKTREWADGRSAGRGVVFPLGDLTAASPILAGLDQPHAPRLHQGFLYCCDSRNGALVRIRDGVRETLHVGHSFTRGLALCGDTGYVGLSCSRNLASEQLTRARLAVIDLVSFTVRAINDLPMQEIYDIAVVSEDRLAAVTRHYNGSPISLLSRSLHAYNALPVVATPPEPVVAPAPPVATLHRFELDVAPQGRITENPFMIAGWFIDEEGRSARQIRIRIGARVIICDPMDRPELLSRFPGVPSGVGFRRLIKTGNGFKWGVLEAETHSGKTIRLYRRLLWLRSPKKQTSSDHAAWLAADALANPPRPAPPGGPTISVLMPVYNAPDRWLRRAIQTVLAQTYRHWELCIANDASTHPGIRPLLDGYAARDPRIKVVHRAQNGHISAASNSALALCTGRFTALLDHVDTIGLHASSALFFRAHQTDIKTFIDLFTDDGVRSPVPLALKKITFNTIGGIKRLRLGHSKPIPLAV